MSSWFLLEFRSYAPSCSWGHSYLNVLFCSHGLDHCYDYVYYDRGESYHVLPLFHGFFRDDGYHDVHLVCAEVFYDVHNGALYRDVRFGYSVDGFFHGDIFHGDRISFCSRNGCSATYDVDTHNVHYDNICDKFYAQAGCGICGEGLCNTHTPLPRYVPCEWAHAGLNMAGLPKNTIRHTQNRHIHPCSCHSISDTPDNSSICDLLSPRKQIKTIPQGQ